MNIYIYINSRVSLLNWTLRKVNRKYLDSFEMWCWGSMDISWTDSLKNEEVLLRVKEERNIPRTVKRRLTGLVTSCLKLPSKTHYWRKVRGDENKRKKCKLLLDLKETVRDLKLKEEVLACILRTVCFGRDYGPVIRQNDDAQLFGVMQKVSLASLITFTELGKGRSCWILSMFRSPLRCSSNRAVIADVDRNVKLLN